MDDTNGVPTTEGQALPGRREVLKRGAAIGGAVVWATPVVQAIAVGTADAASGETSPPPPPPPPPPTSPPPPPPPVVGEIPSHGLFVVLFQGKQYGYQVSATGVIGTLGKGNDIPYLDAKLGAGTYITKDSGGSTVWSTLKSTFSSSVGTYNDGTQLLRAIVVTLPAGGAVQEAASYIFDGSFQGDPDGDKFRDAVESGQTLYFIKPPE